MLKSETNNLDVIIKIDEIEGPDELKGEHTSFVIMPYTQWLEIYEKIKSFFDAGNTLCIYDLRDHEYYSPNLAEFMEDLSVDFLSKEESVSFKKHFPSGKFGPLSQLFNPANFNH